MIDLSALITDPDFCTEFKILRQTGSWTADGIFSATSTVTNVTGIVRPASGEDIQMNPEGDEKRETLNFLTLEQTFLADGTHQSDIFIYNGKRYKAISLRNWEMHGFYKTTAQLIGDDTSANS